MSSTVIDARALLFDMDGTLIDSRLVVERMWSSFAHRFGLDIEDIMQTSHGVRMIDTIRRYLPHGTDIEATAREFSAMELADTEGVVALDGAAAFLASLPAESFALVTSASRVLATSRMAAAGLLLPGTVVTAEDVERGKPHPDGYAQAAGLLGFHPHHAVVFEDAEAGIQAGLAADMRVIVVGDWESDTTRGLPRIPHYSAVTARVTGHTVSISW
jgi:sugar-phosphatase